MIEQRLENARQDLLDLTGRNRLLNTPQHSRVRRIDIVDDTAGRVYEQLVVKQKIMQFVPGEELPHAAEPVEELDSTASSGLEPDDPETTASIHSIGLLPGEPDPSAPAPPTLSPVVRELPETPPTVPEEQPALEGAESESLEGPAPAESDSPPAEPVPAEPASPEAAPEAPLEPPLRKLRAGELQTRLPAEKLETWLRAMYFEARTALEEQGQNMLFLAMGFLEWEERDNDKRRRAPLLLIPVELERRDARAEIQIKFTGEEISTNLSLQTKLLIEHGLKLPDVPEDDEELSPEAYFQLVREAVEGTGWQVHDDEMLVWFFSFSTFLMYHDLDITHWPQDRPLGEHPLLRQLLKEGFPPQPPLAEADAGIESLLPTELLTHALDADSSQAVAIEEARRGRNLVIQGPPGTGKSQTITNLIATAVQEGKTVLFVAEKLAALEVVKRRLDKIGLGHLCLELHSRKSNKREVLEELERTLERPPVRKRDFTPLVRQHSESRDRLHRFCQTMHTEMQPTEFTPFQIVAELVRLRLRDIPSLPVTLPGSDQWNRAEYRQRIDWMRSLEKLLDELGGPLFHPWRGVGHTEPLLPSDLTRLRKELEQLVPLQKLLEQQADEFFQSLRVQVETPRKTVRHLLEWFDIAEWLQEVPRVADRACLLDEVWQREFPRLQGLVQKGVTLYESKTELDPVFSALAWETDVRETLRQLRTHGQSWLRWFSGDYRQARRTLQGILKGPLPKRNEERCELLEKLLAAQKLRGEVQQDHLWQIAWRAFGEHWQGADSDWTFLKQILDWQAEGAALPLEGQLPRLFESHADWTAVNKQADRLEETFQLLKPKLDRWQQSLQFSVRDAFGVPDWADVPMETLRQRRELWQENFDRLPQWVTWRIQYQRLQDQQLVDLARMIDQGTFTGETLADHFQLARCEALMRQVYAKYPELQEFNAARHREHVAEFQRLDLERIHTTGWEVELTHQQQLPRGQFSVGEIGIVRHEMKKKTRHKPIRRLMTEAGRAIQQIKPVLMMSPLSIAQFLEPGAVEFDLLLIDEASQVRPVDALGAVARCRQMVVVGDEKQLPPTSFFDRATRDDRDVEDQEELAAADLESILGLCVSRGLSQTMLRWHYRSLDPSLIALSNQEFYDRQLYILPNPTRKPEKLGLFFHYLPDAVYDRGGSATNGAEAARIAEAVIRHATEHPDKTLGVGTFSMRQRDAVLEEVEKLRRAQPDLERFFSVHADEPFFVKNLENIQGDERDVILISVGYGRDQHRNMTMNFGPLSNEGGERRLNVLITRARERCEVFSSITADDIDLSRTQARGAAALKKFLFFAEKGVLDRPPASGQNYEFGFETQVAGVLRQHGWEVETQIGVGSFTIDLAVVHPEKPNEFLLGIDCDGESYRLARWTRDRDRLREQLLESRGWIMHRINALEWFHHPVEQQAQLLAAVQQALESGVSHPTLAEQAEADQQEQNAARREVETEPDPEPLEESVVDYQLAHLKIPERKTQEIHEVPPERIAGCLVEIVATEGPIHREELTRRLVSLWGKSYAGARMQEAIDAAAARALESGKLVETEGFLQTAGQEIRIRRRGELSDSKSRDPEMLPPEEIGTAFTLLLRHQIGLTREELITQTARLFGYKTTSGKLWDRLESQLETLISTDIVREQAERLYLTKAEVSAETGETRQEST